MNGGARMMTAFALAALAGCTQSEIGDKEIVYTFSLGAIAISILISASFVVGGFVFWWKKTSPVIGLILVCVGVLAFLLIPTNLLSDRVVVTESYFDARYGFWFAQTQHHIRYDELRDIRQVQKRGRRGGDVSYLACTTKNGTLIEVTGDLVRAA